MKLLVFQKYKSENSYSYICHKVIKKIFLNMLFLIMSVLKEIHQKIKEIVF